MSFVTSLLCPIVLLCLFNALIVKLSRKPFGLALPVSMMSAAFSL